jgi:transcriptional regulator with XRE-family HTH domain
MNRIKQLRQQRGLTLEQVADRAGTTFQQVQRLETGKRRLTDTWMRRLAGALGCRPAELMEDPAAATGQEDSVSQRLEAKVIELWRDLSASEKAMALRSMAPAGVEIPMSVVEIPPPGDTNHKPRKRK